MLPLSSNLMYRCLVDVCPVEELEPHKTEIIDQIPQKEVSPEQPPPPLETAVQSEPDKGAKSPSPVVSPPVTTQHEAAVPGPSPPVVLQVIYSNDQLLFNCMLF